MVDKGDEDVRKIFTVPNGLMHLVENKVAQINKRAEKLKVDNHIQIVVVDEHAKYPVLDPRTFHKLYDLPAKAFYLEGGVLLLPGGWKVLAVKKHERGMKVPIVARVSPEGDIPKQYYTSGNHCDHCKMDRPRKTTVVLVNDAGKIMQVGLSCLKDFLGHDPERVIWFAQGLVDLERDIEGMEPSGISRMDQELTFEDYLNAVACLVRTVGYVKMGEAGALGADNRRMEPTADEAWYYWSDLAKGKVEKMGITDADKAKAKAALEWGRKVAPEMRQKSDYWHNMWAVLTADAVTRKTKGLVASVVAAYNRHLEKQQEKERQEKSGANEWVGQEGERLKKLRLRLEKEFESESEWGTTHILKLVDEEGHAFTWFSSSGSDKDGEQWEEGAWYEGAASVKKHDTYRDQKQTVLTRATLTKPIVKISPKTAVKDIKVILQGERPGMPTWKVMNKWDIDKIKAVLEKLTDEELERLREWSRKSYIADETLLGKAIDNERRIRR